MIQTVSYSEPVLCHYNYDLNKSWFVHFDVKNIVTGEVSRQQYRGKINRFKTKAERLVVAGRIISFWKGEIKRGWSPFEKVEKDPTTSFNAAIDFGLSKCKVAKKTYQCYKSTAGFIKSAATKTGLHKKSIADIKRVHIKQILESGQSTFTWSNKSYNKHLNYLKAILTRVVDWEIIENNPALKIKTLPVDETEKYVPYTDAERKAIQEYLFMHHYRFFVFLMFVYHAGVRPKEILALKIKDIDLINMQITILPNMEAGNSKTRKIRKIPISKALLPFLRELQLSAYSRECYVFGSPYEAGKGNRGSSAGGLSGAMHPEYFKPSATMIKRDTVTRLWKKVIMEKLGIEKHLYAAKHSGGNAKIMAGISIDALQELYGHSSRLMTEKYVSELKKVHFNQIIELSPDF
jgi:integrase